MITDDALRAAAKEASLALAETLVHGSSQQPPYIPSKSFTCKMSRLCRRERHPVFYRTIQRVAAVFLALLFTGIGWLTVDAEARAATIAWFRSISQSSIVYRSRRCRTMLRHGCPKASRSRSTTRMICGPVGITFPVQTSLSLKLTHITVVRFYR